MTHLPATTPSRLTRQRLSAWHTMTIAQLVAMPRATRIVILVIALAAVVASLSAQGGVLGILGAALALVMITIAAIDSRSFIIPDVLSMAGLALALVNTVAENPTTIEAMVAAIATALARGAVLALGFLLIRSVYAQVRGREGIGLGDVKLAVVAGAWLDWQMLPIAVEIAACSALSVYVVRHLLFGRPLRAVERVPFGLFFAPAIWVAWLLEAVMF
jgi:leader peptidase (prepilin peptidase) / N-methyltransferase